MRHSDSAPPALSEPAAPAPAGAPAPRRPRPGAHGQGAILAVVACGGVIGACARYGTALAWPTAPGSFPWTTLAVNTAGCFTIGVFMVLITDVWAAHRLVRPFFGTGVLGGFTTFSTYTVDVQRLTGAGHLPQALAYLAGTAAAALAAVWTGASAARRLPGAGRAR